MTTTMQPVNSSNIKAIGYDQSTRTLYVQFNSNSTWEYDLVPIEIYDALSSADSKGKYYNSIIKHAYRGRQI